MLGQPNGLPLNEAQKAELNGHVKDLPVIMELHDDMTTLKDGQNEIMDEFQKHEEENKRQFDHGSEIMQELGEKTDRNAAKIDEVAKEMADFKEQMTNQHNELLGAIKDEKTKQLESKLEDIVKKKEKNENRLWDILKIVIVFSLGVGATYFGLK